MKSNALNSIPGFESVTDWRFEIGLVVCLAALIGYSWLFRDVTSPNERSRILLSVSLIDHETVSVEKAVERFGKPLDIARYQGEYRSDKAPGASFLGAIVYGTVRLWSSPEDWSMVDLLDLMRFWLMIPFSLLGFLMLREVLRDIGLDPPVVDLTSLGWILGTSAFHYSNAFFGHQIAAVSLIGAIWGILKARDFLSSNQIALERCFAMSAGLFAGLAGLTEYPAGIPVLLISGFAYWELRRYDTKAFFVFGGAGLSCLVLLLMYHKAAFGGYVELPYFHLVEERFSMVHETGFLGFKLPHVDWLYGGMLSLHRGLFATSPFYILIFPGFWFLWKNNNPMLAILVGAIFGYYTVLISAWPLWEGGWGYGPRHLVAMLGVSAIPVGAAIQMARGDVLAEGICRGLLLFGIGSHQLVGAFFPEMPPEHTNPLMDGIGAMMNHGLVAPNLLTHFEVATGLVTLVPIGILLSLVAGLILGRGLVQPIESRGRLISTLSVSVVIVALGALMIWSAGRQIDSPTKHDFIDQVKHFQRAEQQLKH